MPTSTTIAPTTTRAATTRAATTRRNRAIDLAGRLVVAPALLIAPFVAIDRAAAACDPTSPVNNATVTCTGTTTNQNGNGNGYGAGNDTGNTINVQPGASVTGTTNGLRFSTGTVNNLGTIKGGLNGILTGTATVNNSGTIIGTGANGAAINAITLTVTNSGTISTTNGVGITAGNTLDVTNLASGVITAGNGGSAIAVNAGTVNNSGTITAGTGGVGIVGFTANVTNTGTISAGTGIQLLSGGTTITNSGTIIGLGGEAIVLGTNGNTLNLLPGSHIIGSIFLAGRDDVVNFVSGGGVAQLITLNNNFSGTINTSGVGPVVNNTNQIATLDLTAFGQADRTLMDFTGGVSSLVQSRLGGAPPNGSIQAVSYAPESAMPNGLIRKAPPAGYAAPTVVWTGSFGGARSQDGTDETFRTRSTFWGGLIGVDRQVRSDLLVGAFVGGGTGRLTVDKGSQSVHTDSVGGGVYGRFDWASHFLDFTVQGGSTESKSTRLVISNLALNGLENATARSSGWFVSPELTYGMRYALGNGNTLTPFARVRYLAGIFDGYSESGSAQNLSVGRRTLQDVEERGELELSRTASFGTDTVKTNVHGGVIALQRVGDTNVNTVLIGQNLTFATPGKDSTVGAVAGAGFDLTINKRVSVFGAMEGTVMSDKSHTVTGKAGMRVGF
jgi:hypothetical protein